MGDEATVAGKVALVTGGASGIGLASATRLAAEGATVVVADVDVVGGVEAAAAVGGRFVDLDVTDPAAWRRFVDDLEAHEGRLDLAHLNAGVTTGGGDLASLTDEQYRRVLGVNVDGVVFGSRALQPLLAQERGALVVTASMAGIAPWPGDPVYTLTKHAVVGLVRALAGAWEPLGITVGAVCPGIVDTPLVPDEARPLLEGAGVELISAEHVAGTVLRALTSGRTGECWSVRAGHDDRVAPAVAMDLSVT